MAIADYLPWRVWEARGAARRTPPPPVEPAHARVGGMIPARSGFISGVPPQGVDENDLTQGAATATDRQSLLQELWEEYLSCPWAWSCVNSIARTVTAGGLVMKWDSDTGEGDQTQPEKPAPVLAFERLISFTNPKQDIRQLMRNAVADLQVFGDAFVEVVWLGKLPVALYNLDCPTTFPQSDAHGNVTKYVQVTQFGQRAEFQPHQVIHISLDSARPSLLGVSPTHAAEQSIVSWMFLHSCEKEAARRGLPPNVHADLPTGYSDPDARRWQDQYVTRNLGPQNVGTPITTKGGGVVKELQTAKLPDILLAKKAARDEIISAYGVPPAKVGIIEAGNLGGGTGSDQNKTFWLDTINPVAMLIAEKLQFHLAVQAFGIRGWHVEFGGVDYRDDRTIEDIRDMRLRNGSWILNRYRSDIGEPSVEGGDKAVLVARQDIVQWSDMAARSAAAVAALDPADYRGNTGRKPGPPPEVGTHPSKGLGGAPDRETVTRITAAVVRELRPNLRVVSEHTPRLTTRDKVQNQLSARFSPKALKWVKTARWDGPVYVPISQVATEDLTQWAAAHDGPDIKRLRRKLRKTGRLKPVVLVVTPGSPRAVIVDGHHHALAALKEGHPVRAYVGHVNSTTGGWQVMATQQHRKTA